jgi:hypothetical protein
MGALVAIYAPSMETSQLIVRHSSYLHTISKVGEFRRKKEFPTKYMVYDAVVRAAEGSNQIIGSGSHTVTSHLFHATCTNAWASVFAFSMRGLDARETSHHSSEKDV